MKKILPIIIAVVAVIIIAVVAIVLITGNNTPSADDNNNNTPPVNDNTNNTPTEKDYNLAIGVVVNNNLTKKETTETVAAIVTDADGKIVLCRFDCIAFTAKYTDGVLNTTAPISKVAQGEDYDKDNYMKAGDWYVQTGKLADNLVGKTQAEVAAVALNNGYLADADLKAQCSINVADLIKAVDNAFKSEYKTAFKSTATTFTAGVAVIGKIADTANDTAKNAKFTADFAASILAEGKVVASILDTAEVELKNITEEGAAEAAFKGTKREQGASYDASQPMAAGTWYVQADAYALAANGKTATDIDTLATEGVAGCTITATGYKQVIAAAVKAAK